MRRIVVFVMCFCLLLSSTALAVGNSNETTTGTVKGCITWQYNDYVGTKPDVGAYIALFPYDGDNIIDQDYREHVTFVQDIRGESLLYGGKRMYGGEADGYGNYIFDNVIAGKYLLLIVSKKTTGEERFNDESAWMKKVESLFGFLRDDAMEYIKIFLGYNKYTFDVIDVLPDKTITVSYDFGNAYIAL